MSLADYEAFVEAQLEGCLSKVHEEARTDGNYGQYSRWLKHSVEWATILNTLRTPASVEQSPMPAPSAPTTSSPTPRRRQLDLNPGAQ